MEAVRRERAGLAARSREAWESTVQEAERIAADTISVAESDAGRIREEAMEAIERDTLAERLSAEMDRTGPEGVESRVIRPYKVIIGDGIPSMTDRRE